MAKAPPTTKQPGAGDVLGGVALDMLADNLVTDKSERDPAKRDEKDAQNADTAFNSILALAVSSALTGGAAATVGGLIVGGAPGVVAAAGTAAIMAAATATKVAWQKLSEQDRAAIWRGEIT